MLKKTSNWFGEFDTKIVIEDIEGSKPLSIAIAKKEELFNLLAHYYEDKDLNEPIILSLYKLVERSTEYSLADIDDDMLIGLLQKHILERDFSELTSNK